LTDATHSAIYFDYLHRVSSQGPEFVPHIPREAVPKAERRGQHPRHELLDLHPLPTAGDVPAPNACIIRDDARRDERRQHQVRHVREEHRDGLRFISSVTDHPRGRSAPRHDPAHPEEHCDLLRRELPHDLPILVTTALVRLELDAAGCPRAGAGGSVHAEEQCERAGGRHARAAAVEPPEELDPPGAPVRHRGSFVAKELGGDGGAEPPEDVVEVRRRRRRGSGQTKGGGWRREGIRQRVGGGAGEGGAEEREGEGGGGESLLLPLLVRLWGRVASRGGRAHGRRGVGAAAKRRCWMGIAEARGWGEWWRGKAESLETT
jgi:hypothetical protein